MFKVGRSVGPSEYVNERLLLRVRHRLWVMSRDGRCAAAGMWSILTLRRCYLCPGPEVLALKQESRILGHSSDPVYGYSMMEQVRLCAVLLMFCPWLGSFSNLIQGCNTVRESYSRALEQ